MSVTTERNCSQDQDDPEPPQIKEELEDFCINQEGGQIDLKKETDDIILTPINEGNDESDSIITYIIGSNVSGSNNDLQ